MEKTNVRHLLRMYFRHGANKSTLTPKEQRILANIKASVRNARDDGFLGGETGVSQSHLSQATAWLQEIIAKYQLKPVTRATDPFYTPRIG